MNNNAIQAVIFDLGNVLVSFDHTIAAKKIRKFTDKPEDEIYNLFFDSGITGIFEEGKLTPQDFFSQVKEALALRLDYHDFMPIWNEIFFLTPENTKVYQLAKNLKNKYKIALLSNINVLHFDYLKENFYLFDAFHHILTSFELGVRKPDPGIYHKAIAALGVGAAQNIFYTDDRPELVKKAGEIGIRSFIFKNTAQLKKDLKKMRIDVR